MFETDFVGLLGSAVGIGGVVAVVALLAWLCLRTEEDSGWAAVALVALLAPFTIGIPVYVLLVVTGVV